jgi:rhomboid family GlyGly-CTERM serine protease
MLKVADYRLPVSLVSNLTLPWQTLSLAVAALMAYMALGPVPETWVYDRTAIANGEVWRLVTGHWVHSGPSHALWNIAALMLLGLLFERCLQSFLLIALIAGTVAVDAWLWWGDSSLTYYCGLSGILNSLLIVGLARFWRVYKHPLILFIAIVAVLKIVAEISIGQGLFTRTTWPSVPTVHAAGFLGGLGLVMVVRAVQRRVLKRVS